MSLRWLLDTNALSEPVRPRPDRAFVARIRDERHRVAVPSVAWHELRFGVERLSAGRRRDALVDYLEQGVRSAFPILPYDERAADWHAAERARLEREGRTAPFADGQVAAIAATRGLVLVTANAADFQGFEGLVVEDWRSRGA